ncbi:MAG: hypothetical protein H7Y43_09235 [Akkermansiaceae bacterium]|nr:hypothetical protein [Verrucomicrobiales bacterium]
MNPIYIIGLTTLVLISGVKRGVAQGTAFTYQGRLNSGGNLVNGRYDFNFALFSAVGGSGQVGSTQSYTAVPVSNGLFTVVLNFGAIFQGADRWLELSVRTNGVGAFTTLTPRQAVLPTPYAMYAANAAQVGGQNSSAFVAKAGDTMTGPLNLTANGLNVGSGQLVTSGGAVAAGGSLIVDSSGLNSGAVNPGLTFGFGSGEGISSKRTGGGNQFGLDLFTGGSPRLSIASSGNVGIGTITPAARLEIQGGADHTGANDLRGIALAYRNGGFRHWISSRHNGAVTDNGIDFYLNTHSVSSGSSAPGVGNKKVMTLDSANGIKAMDGLIVDADGSNTGTVSRAALTFGVGSGEGLASRRSSGGNQYGLDFYTDFQKRLSIANNGNVGIGTATPQDSLLDIEGDTHINDHDLFMRGGSNRDHGIGYRSMASGQGIDGPFVYGFNGGALGVSGPDSIALKWDFNGNVWVSNDISVATLTIRGGADLAEPFPMAADIPKGALVVIDEERAGALKLSDTPYDNRVAGIVSGANGVRPGLTLQQEGMLETGQQVALTGRVYALADASNGAIKPGDLLTSSRTPGHVMRVTEHARAQGAVVGKAMSSLKNGKGMVLVLVNLQ